MGSYKYIFGPVPSRRLGVSLGIDLVPLKTCTMNCVYCEVGKTNKMTLNRSEYVSYEEVIGELREYLSGCPELDYITFSGSGEPTLNSKIGDIINFLKSDYSQYKLALLTNGSLFTDEQLRAECMELDLILPSLDAVSKQAFKRINRPHPKLVIEEIIEGLVLLRKEFKGEIWIEIFVVPGINDTEEEMELIKSNIKRINPDKIQLNFLDRPGTESWVKPLEGERLKFVLSKLGELGVEVIGNFTGVNKLTMGNDSIEELLLSLVSRRPSTINDLLNATGIKRNEINKYIWMLISKGDVKSINTNGDIYYSSIKQIYNS